jgi:hypothetical protein
MDLAPNSQIFSRPNLRLNVQTLSTKSYSSKCSAVTCRKWESRQSPISQATHLITPKSSFSQISKSLESRDLTMI